VCDEFKPRVSLKVVSLKKENQNKTNSFKELSVLTTVLFAKLFNMCHTRVMSFHGFNFIFYILIKNNFKDLGHFVIFEI